MMIGRALDAKIYSETIKGEEAAPASDARWPPPWAWLELALFGLGQKFWPAMAKGGSGRIIDVVNQQ
jgi:hypothetical protein